MISTARRLVIIPALTKATRFSRYTVGSKTSSCRQTNSGSVEPDRV
jgi:hypothetical protein